MNRALTNRAAMNRAAIGLPVVGLLETASVLDRKARAASKVVRDVTIAAEEADAIETLAIAADVIVKEAIEKAAPENDRANAEQVRRKSKATKISRRRPISS